MRRFLWVYFIFNLILSGYYIDSWSNSNTVSRALPIITWYEEGTFKIDKYHKLTCDKAFVNDHYYTDKAPLPTYAVLPFFGLMKSLGVVKPDENGNLWGKHVLLLGSFLLASLPFALILLSLFKNLQSKNVSLSPVLLSMLPFYGSFIFVFAGTYFSHLFAGSLLLLSYTFLKRDQFFIAGIFAGLSFLSEYNLAIFIFMLGIMILVRYRRIKPFMFFSCGILPSLLFIIYYNSLFSSSPFTFMYKHHNFTELEVNYIFVLPGIKSIWGLSFSPYRGMFFFAPVLLLLAYVLYVRMKSGAVKSVLKSYLFFPFLVYFICMASYFAWWGGWTYGPRLLLAVILVVVYEGIIRISDQKLPALLFFILTAFGLVINFAAKFSIVYSARTGIMNPFKELALKQLFEGNFNPNNILNLAFGTGAGWAALIFTALFTTGLIFLTVWYRKLKNNQNAEKTVADS
ncbi:MAG: hypothetical protein JXA03_11120 [Bacteroidales bacterium]|nr:hypothetical protein [Bacteroidales bacterium]